MTILCYMYIHRDIYVILLIIGCYGHIVNWLDNVDEKRVLSMSDCREFEFRYRRFVGEEVDLFVIESLDNLGFLGLI